MNLGRRPGRLAQRLMSPVGRPILAIMFVATAAIVFATRLPVEPVVEWTWSPVDLRLYANPALVKDSSLLRRTLLTPEDYAYAAGLAGWCFCIVWVTVRTIGSLALVFWFRQHAASLRIAGRMLAAVTVLVLVSAVCVGIGWPYRLGTNWAARALSSEIGFGTRSIATVNAGSGQCFVRAGDVTDAQRFSMLRSAARYGRTDNDRVMSLSLAMVHPPRENVRRLAADIIQHDRSPTVLRAAILTLAIFREPSDAKVIEPLLDHPDGTVRATAIDALAFMHVVRFDPSNWVDLTTSPPISLSRRLFDDGADALRQPHWAAGKLEPTVQLDQRPLSQKAIETMVARLTSPHSTPDEREAAARANQSIASSTNTRIRWAECSLWRQVQADASDPRGGLMRRPSHVAVEHAGENRKFGGQPWITGGSVDSTAVASVAFLSANQPVVADVSLALHRGVCDVVSPVPDDRVAPMQVVPLIADTRVTSAIRQFVEGADVATRQPWATHPQRRGYPWLNAGPFRRNPAPNVYENLMAKYVATGYVWQSLIVTPDHQPWMSLPSANGDGEAWWNALRSGSAGGVWSRGHAEKFLYYEGRTFLPLPLRIRQQGDKQWWAIEPDDDPRKHGEESEMDISDGFGPEPMDQTGRKGRRDERRGMFVTVSTGGIAAEVVDVPVAGAERPSKPHQLGAAPPLRDDEVRQTLRRWVIDAGLTAQEADAALGAWDDLLFKTDGRRVLVLLAAVDSDSRCRLTIRPRPAEIIRVGIGWWEL